MLLCTVHCLGEADVTADCGAEEVEEPERGDDSAVEFSEGMWVRVECSLLFSSVFRRGCGRIW